jgi:DNA-binding NarL/FixJ family response regulator
MTAIRVVIADDHQAVRAGIRFLLKSADDITVVGEASDGAEALRLAHTLEPDVLLLDMEMSELSGVEVSRRLQAIDSPVRVLVLSAYDERQYILNTLASGAAGYLVKREAPDTIVKAIRSVGRGETGWLSRQVASRISGLESAEGSAEPMALADEEQELLRLLLAQKSYHEIASALRLDEATVARKMSALYEKIGAGSRAEAMVFAIRRGLDRGH